MACPTCDHSMHMVGKMMEPLTAAAVFWCPRCGTLKSNVVVDGQPFDGSARVPKLVDRVIELGGLIADEHEDLYDDFERLGIVEAISLDQ
jgi:hypothetical protein